ncbi:hypothetical protein pdam_00025245 [Pocillopora damicornis]|uniref:EGF-like domain-containing protein n=1 Tax=Pocillopora damicornis TaxID=46731 RepID=A0A3M6TZS0_POCDA|nr:hypothetical protein pdam_00025245 [Pocillopora damicornis]
MAWQISYITVVIMISRVFYITNHKCGTDVYSFYQMMLKGHTFKSFPVRPGSLDCREACLADSRCQSYNVVFKGICELNNRTREARPENFVRNQERYYMKKSSNIDADECQEGLHGCHSNVTCYNTEGAYICICKVGFSGTEETAVNQLGYEDEIWHGGTRMGYANRV